MTINYNPLIDHMTDQRLFDMAKQAIGLNGIYAEAIIANSPVNKYYDDIKITTLTSIKRGDLIIYNHAYWLVLSEVATTRHGKYKATVRHIPYALQMKVGEDKKIIGYGDMYNPIYGDAVPIYKNVFFIIQDNPNIQTNNTGAVTYVDGSMTIITRDETDSSLVEGFTFNLLGKSWIISYVDISKKGLRILQCDDQASEANEDPTELPTPVTPEKPSAPSVPTNVVATVNSQTSVTLTWDTVSQASSYTVYRDNVSIASNLTNPTYTDTTLTASTTYSYQVSASNSVGESERSDAISATTQDAPSWDSTGDPAIDAYAARHPELGDPNDINNNNYFEDTITGYDEMYNPIMGRGRRTDIDYNS